MVEPRLLEILRCPLTRQRMRMVQSGAGESGGDGRSDSVPGEFLETVDGRYRYPVIDDLPMLTPSDALETTSR